MTDVAPAAGRSVPPVSALLRLTWWKLALALGSGLLTALCFPPGDYGPLAWLALAPFFFALTQVRPLGGLLLGIVYGYAFLGSLASFMLIYGHVEWAATVGFEALFLGLFAMAAAACNRVVHPALRALGVAAAWTLAEMLRGGIGSLGFTVGDLGYTQHDQVPLLQTAAMVGHYGLGFFIAGINALLTQAILGVIPGIFARPLMHPRQFAQSSARAALAGYVVVIMLYLWGAIVMRADERTSGPTIEAAVVQAALGDSEGATRGDADQALETYLALSETIPEAVDLIVWPEVAVPDSLNQRPDMLARLGEHAHRQSAWLIVGGFEFAEGRVFNSLYVFSPDGVHTETYRKVILVPFGEYVPMRHRFPWLARFALRSVDFSPGPEHRLLRLGDWRGGPLICFEGLFPKAVRANVRLGAEFIVIGTSDAWAAGTAEIEQHSFTAPLRAVESRRWLVRAGTWGISQIVSPYGRVVAHVPDSQPGVAWAPIEPRRDLSVYQRFGDAPMLTLCLALLGIALFSPQPRLVPPTAPGSQPATESEEVP